jgi:hypothetical protein
MRHNELKKSSLKHAIEPEIISDANERNAETRSEQINQEFAMQLKAPRRS